MNILFNADYTILREVEWLEVGSLLSGFISGHNFLAFLFFFCIYLFIYLFIYFFFGGGVRYFQKFTVYEER